MKYYVYQRDNFECQKCGSQSYIECHHIVPRKIDKTLIFSADNCITLCHKCHVWVHTQLPGCTYQELREYNNEENKESEDIN